MVHEEDWMRTWENRRWCGELIGDSEDKTLVEVGRATRIVLAAVACCIGIVRFASTYWDHNILQWMAYGLEDDRSYFDVRCTGLSGCQTQLLCYIVLTMVLTQKKITKIARTIRQIVTCTTCKHKG